MDLLNDNLNRYKQKYYLNLLLKGSLILVAFLVAVFLLFNTVEYVGRFGKSMRAFLLFSFVATALFSMTYWVIIPLLKMLQLSKQISDEEAARQIGNYFENINDKLLNALQLRKIEHKTELLVAGIEQKGKELSIFHFPDAIDLSENKKYIRYFLFLLLFAFAGFMIGGMEFFTEPSKRILRYSETFADAARDHRRPRLAGRYRRDREERVGEGCAGQGVVAAPARPGLNRSFRRIRARCRRPRTS